MAIKRIVPSSFNADSDAVTYPSRTGAYLEAYTIPLGAGDYAFADEGSCYVCTNPTTASGIAGHAAPVVADTDTKALLHLYNGGTKTIQPHFLELEVTAVGTNGTITYAVCYIDNKGSTALVSGGTTITPVNVRSDISTVSSAIITFGACVTAMTSSRKVGQQICREVIPVVQDTMVLRFGSPNMSAHFGMTSAGTATSHGIIHFSPVVIGPGGNLNISLIRPSQSAAASYQFTFGYVER